MRPIVTVVAWSVCLSVTNASPARTDELIEMPFGDVDCGGHKEPCVRGGPGIRISPHEESLRCYAWACPDLLVVDIFNVIRKGQQRCGLWLPALYAVHTVCGKRHRTIECPSVCLSVCLSVPSIFSSSGGLRVCGRGRVRARHADRVNFGPTGRRSSVLVSTYSVGWYVA